MNKKSWLNGFGILLIAWLGMSLPPLSDRPASAESSVSQPGVKRKQIQGFAELDFVVMIEPG